MLIGTYKMKIAVCFNGEKLIIDCEEFYQREHWLDGISCDDNGFQNVPEGKGIYECSVELRAWGDGEDADFEFNVINSKRVWDIGL